jgi:membrane dipeptidase
VNLTVGPVGNRPESEALEGIFRDLGYGENEMDHHPDVFRKIKNYEDINLAKTSRKVGIIFGLQDGVAFENDLTRLQLLYRFGIRIIQPTYNLRNLLGDGCLELDNAGLSKMGQDAVHRMNELGILVDLSHCGKKTTMDAITLSNKPVAFTHTGCAAIFDHPRNKTDDQLRALADKGGVAGIYFMPYLRESGQQRADDVLKHIDHAIQVAGEDHVGIGTDGSISPLEFTPEYMKAHQEEVDARRKAGIGAPGETADVHLYVPELNTPRRFETFADMLLQKGYSEVRIEKIIGGNFARLFKEVWI